MSERWLNARREGGWFNPTMINEAANTLFKNVQMLGSADESELQPGEATLLHPRYEKAMRIPVRLAPELSVNGAPALLGAIEDLAEMGTSSVRRIDIADAEKPLICIRLEETVRLDDLHRFEVVLTQRLVQGSQPRTLFLR
jgi:hypothetical protein